MVGQGDDTEEGEELPCQEIPLASLVPKFS